MAIPLTTDQWLTKLRAEGVNIREHKSWRTHGRDSATGKKFGPVNGVVIHHTAGRDSLALCYSGTSSLPGPLCHTHLSKSGVASMISAGRANHAGTFAQNAHDAVVAESSVHPRPDTAEPVDGNDHYYGLEIENLGDGKDPYPKVQYEQAVRWAAALCRAHGWTADSVIGHKEGTRRKIDPTFDMNTFRKNVAERLKHPAGWTPGTVTEPPKEENVALTTDDVRKVWLTDGFITNPNPDTAGGNPYIAPATGLRNVEIVTRRTDKAVAALTAQVAALVAVVTALSQGGGLDAAEIQAAAEAGAQAALERLGEALREDS